MVSGPLAVNVPKNVPTASVLPVRAPVPANQYVGDRPAGDDRVERQDARAGQHPEDTDEPPAGVRFDCVERPNRGQLRVPADGQLRHHDRQTDQDDAEEVDEHEDGAAALSDAGRKPPDVPQAHGGAGGGQDEPGPRTPCATISGGCHLPSSSCRRNSTEGYTKGDACRQEAGGSRGLRRFQNRSVSPTSDIDASGLLGPVLSLLSPVFRLQPPAGRRARLASAGSRRLVDRFWHGRRRSRWCSRRVAPSRASGAGRRCAVRLRPR